MAKTTVNNVKQAQLESWGMGQYWEAIRKYRTKLNCLSEHDVFAEGFVVDGRALHKALGIKKDFSDWVKYQVKKRLELVEDVDYEQYQGLSTPKKGSAKARPQKTVEYRFTLDVAKSIAMMSGGQEGKTVRNYFLVMEKINNHLLVWNRERCDEVGSHKTLWAALSVKAGFDKEKTQLLISEAYTIINQKAFGEGYVKGVRDKLTDEQQLKLKDAIIFYENLTEVGMTHEQIAGVWGVSLQPDQRNSYS